MNVALSPHKVEQRDGMMVEWDVPITADDGLVLRADVFRPIAPGRYPVLLSYGPYAKGLAFQDAYKVQWDKMVAEHPDVLAGESEVTSTTYPTPPTARNVATSGVVRRSRLRPTRSCRCRTGSCFWAPRIQRLWPG